jgi:hypothetical protein
MSSIFTTLYQNSYPDLFGNLAITARFLYDATIGSYAYDGIDGDRALSFSILLTFHTFMGNVFLLNYLIAILSTTYETLLTSGIFMYKVNLYQYCERYIIAFEDKSYGEIIVHPPPISYLSTLMLPFVLSKCAMVHISKFFSYMMHWLENLVFILGFYWFEFFIAPLAYVKIWINLCFGTRGKI